jgi:hypothetical protein
MAMAGGKEFIGRVSAGLLCGRDVSAAASIADKPFVFVSPQRSNNASYFYFASTSSIHNIT